MPAKLSQQRQQIRWSIPLSVFSSMAKLVQEGKEVFLKRRTPRVEAAQASQNGGHQQAPLGLPHIVLAGSQLQPMLNQAKASALLDLVGYLCNEPCHHIFHHDRLQHETSLEFSHLNERAAAQSLDRLQHLSVWYGDAKHRQQRLESHRLAQD